MCSRVRYRGAVMRVIFWGGVEGRVNEREVYGHDGVFFCQGIEMGYCK